MDIPFVKAEGAGNDFLITRAEHAPAEHWAEAARAICSRQMGVGADGWYLVRISEDPVVTAVAGIAEKDRTDAVDAEIHLYNSDGSEAELSGNGTRCVVAWLASRRPGQTRFQVRTGAGIRHLHLLGVEGYRYRIGMQMGWPTVSEEEDVEIVLDLPQLVRGRRVDPGNPQFAVQVPDLDFAWKQQGELLEGHPTFPNRSNISFYRPVEEDRIEARFYERGAGATLSSGTGSTGALAAALHRGLVLEGAATLLAEGVFHWNQ